MCGAMRIARRLPFPAEASSKRVVTEISNIMRVSNNRWLGRSFASSIPSAMPEVKKGRKRVSKNERQAMVESFVNKYRAMNFGKFPTVSDARKEVGGSYYVIRKFVQELEYKSKSSSMTTRNETSSGRELYKENEFSTEVEEVSSSQMALGKDAQSVNGVDTGDSSSKHFEMKEGPQTSILVENALSEEVANPTGTCDDSKYVATKSHLLKREAKFILHPCPEKPEDNIKEKTPSEDVPGFFGSKDKAEQQQLLPELEKFVRDSSEKQTDEELKNKPSMWGNLKSLADGIINIWRKL